jgi:hypothetical protein
MTMLTTICTTEASVWPSERDIKVLARCSFTRARKLHDGFAARESALQSQVGLTSRLSTAPQCKCAHPSPYKN